MNILDEIAKEIDNGKCYLCKHKFNILDGVLGNWGYYYGYTVMRKRIHFHILCLMQINHILDGGD